MATSTKASEGQSRLPLLLPIPLTSYKSTAAIVCCWLACQCVVATTNRDEFLQRFFAELRLPHAATTRFAFHVVWDSSFQQRGSPSGTLHCFNPSADLDFRENRPQAQLAVAAARLPLQEGRRSVWGAAKVQACVGRRCLEQQLGIDDGRAAMTNVTELLLRSGVGSSRILPMSRTQSRAKPLCVQLLTSASGTASSSREMLAIHSVAVLLIYEGASPTVPTDAVLQAMLEAARKAVTAIATTGVETSNDRQQQRQLQASPGGHEAQSVAEPSTPSSPSPLGGRHQRSSRGSGQTGPAGPCALREWVVHYDQLPASYHDSPYFPRIQPVNYCAGSCESRTPYSSLNFTANSFLRTLSLGDGATGTLLPKPCCVPIAYHAVPMGYLERSGTVRIDLRTDLVVRACGCR